MAESVLAARYSDRFFICSRAAICCRSCFCLKEVEAPDNIRSLVPPPSTEDVLRAVSNGPLDRVGPSRIGDRFLLSVAFFDAASRADVVTGDTGLTGEMGVTGETRVGAILMASRAKSLCAARTCPRLPSLLKAQCWRVREGSCTRPIGDPSDS